MRKKKDIKMKVFLKVCYDWFYFLKKFFYLNKYRKTQNVIVFYNDKNSRK